ncbi:hypothetical protein MZM54_03020 [[Brevibacterium] frigoritolerans]|nr:hypothetical protein [Peribacillus frigoritolerans]
MEDKRKLFICKDPGGQIYATATLAPGESLATCDELERAKWLYERFPNSVFVVKQ